MLLVDALKEVYKALGGSADDVANMSQNADVIAAIATKAGGGLPEVTSADNGDVLAVVEGAWGKSKPSGGNVVVYEVDRSTTSSGFRLMLKNGKTIGDLLQDADNKKIIVLHATSQLYYLETYINGILEFSMVRYWISGRKIQINYVTSSGHAPTENEISGAMIELAPPSST